MSLTTEQQKIVTQIEKMLPVYQGKNLPGLEAPLKNIEWNLKKLHGQGGETLAPETWAAYTKDDFAKIAAVVKPGESGDEFASDVANRIDAAFSAQPAAAPAAPAATSAPAEVVSAASAAVVAAATTTTTAASSTDVSAILAAKADAAGAGLDWKHSVVDLFKVVGLDHSLATRRKVAANLGLNESEVHSVGSEEGNILLHQRLLGVLASNGGNLPANLA